MPWAKFCDKTNDDLALIEAGPYAQLLFMRGVIFCASNQTDGIIKRIHVRFLVRWGDEKSLQGKELPDNFKIAKTLVKHGLWERVRGGFRVRNYLKYNPSREQLFEQKNQRREAGRKGGLVKYKNKSSEIIEKSASEVLSKPQAKRQAKFCPVPVPVPVPHPVHLHEQDTYICRDSGRPNVVPEPGDIGAGSADSRTHVDEKISSPKKHPPHDSVQQVVDHYRSVHPRRGRHLKSGHQDWRIIQQRLADGFTVEDLCHAIDGNAVDAWHADRKAHDIRMVFRNAGKVERFIAQKLEPTRKRTGSWLDAVADSVGNRGENADRLGIIHETVRTAQGTLLGTNDRGRISSEVPGVPPAVGAPQPGDNREGVPESVETVPEFTTKLWAPRRAMRGG